MPHGNGVDDHDLQHAIISINVFARQESRLSKLPSSPYMLCYVCMYATRRFNLHDLGSVKHDTSDK